MTTYDFNLITAFANSAPSNEIETFPDYDRGLGIAFVETDGKPEMKGLNGLFSLMTVSLLALKQRGILTWTTGFEYKQGAFAVESNKLYQAKIDNTSKQPSLSQNEWQVWASVSDIDVDTNGNIIKTTKAGGAFTLKVNDASTTVKGVVRKATATEVSNVSNVNAYVTPIDASNISKSTDFGIDQTPVNVTSSRSKGVNYTNPSDKTITIYITTSYHSDISNMSLYLNDINVQDIQQDADGTVNMWVTLIVPPKMKYRIETNKTIIKWIEVK